MNTNDGTIFFIFIFLLPPIIYLMYFLRSWREKATKWDELQKIMYGEYVKNIEELLRDREKQSFVFKVDYIFNKITEIIYSFRTKKYIIENEFIRKRVEYNEYYKKA